MASGTITPKKSVTGKVTAGGGTNDHNRLYNREDVDQHPIEAITNLRKELDSKLDSETALPLIEEAIKYKAKGLYYDLNCELSKKPYWYLTSEIDPITKLGTKTSVISGPYDLGAGGGGGGGGGVTEVKLEIAIDEVTGKKMWPYNIAVGASCIVGVNWSSLRDGSTTGRGTMYCYVSGKLVETRAVAQGLVTFDLTEYIVSGENKVEIKVVDAYSTTKNLIDTITGVTLRLASNFEDNLSYTGDINFPYTPTGDITKYVYFFVDGYQQGEPEVVDTTGEQWIRTLPSGLFSHGSHTLKVYFTCTIDGEEVKSNELYYDIIYYERGKTTPIIASPFVSPAEYEQYVSFNVKYRVYTPNKNTSKINLYIDGAVSKSLTVDTSYQLWECRFDVVGNHALEIRTGTVSKTFIIHTTESTIHVDPVAQGVELALSSYGRENTEPIEERKKWDYIIDPTKKIEGKLSNFNWTSNGWVKDTDGNTVLRLSGDARLNIEFKPFETDFTSSGKTFEFEIATSDVKSYESRIGECLDGADTITHSQFYAGEDTRTKKFVIDEVDNNKFIDKVLHVKGTYIFKYIGNETWDLDDVQVSHDELFSEYGITVVETGGSSPIVRSEHYLVGDRIIVYYTVSGCGFYITPQLAKLQSKLTSLSTQYKEDDKVRLTFVVESRSAGTAAFKTRLIYMYINGIMSGVARYSDGDSFQQTPAKFITFGSNDATLDIYNIRIYNQALTRRQVVNNWIADTKDPVLKTKRYRHNDNYDNDTGKIIIDKIAALGNLPYLVAETETLPSYKKDRKYAKITYTNPGDTDRNFTAEEARMDVQGTSSSGYFKKNFKIKYEGGFYDKDMNWSEHYFIRGKEKCKKEKEFVYKADVASSEGANNVELVRYFEDTKNWFSPPELQPDTDLGTTDSKLRIRVGIDGLPIVMFHNDGKTTSFYGKMNFNNDKGNKRTFGFTEGDESWEFLHNTSDLVLFKSDNLTNWAESFESRYPEEAGEDEHPYGTLPEEREKLQAVMTWVVSTYRKATDSEEVKAEKLAKFKNEFSQHFDLTSSLFYYLYTELFLLVDSRAKNAMMTYYTSRDGGLDGGNRWFWIPYDMDTALGINNEGLLVYNYDKEDTDYQEGAYIFNGQDSVFWNNVRDAFGDELKSMYNILRSSKTEDRLQWSFASAEKYFEDHQAVWSESIFNEDAYEKYLYPYIYNQDATYLGMAQGSKEQQRRWWMYNRFRYMDSKYCSGDAAACQIMMRPYWSHAPYKSFETLEEYAGTDKYGQPYYILFNAGTESADIKAFNTLTDSEKEWVKTNKPIAYTKNVFNIKPYINSYVTIRPEKQDNMISTRASMGVDNILYTTQDWKVLGKDAVLWIDSADLLEDVGDLSIFKPGYADFSKATKLKRLIVGSADSTYENGNLKGLNVGANHLLTYLDARNCKNLGVGEGTEVTPTIDLSNCYSIEEVYFNNTQIKGCSFPVGGNLKKVYLPETLTSLTIRNHPNLTEFNLAGTSNLTSIWLEAVPSTAIDSYDYVMAMPDGSRVRLIDIDDVYDSETTIIDFYNKLDQMHGLDDKGDYTSKAQVTGKIRLETISYYNYVTLMAKYPEVEIIPNIIRCNVNFYNEGEKFNEQVLAIEFGKTAKANDPGIPEKSSTQEHYYTFKEWRIFDPDTQEEKDVWTINTEINTDLSIKAKYDEHIQVYRATFNTRSTIIKVDPEYEDADYNTLIHEPTLIDVPEKVEYIGWFRQDGTQWNFAADTIKDHITLNLKVDDKDKPKVVLTRNQFNKFDYVATDNVGIEAYAVTNSDVIPTSWIQLETPITPFTGTYTINNSGDYYFWVKDAQGNTINSKIISRPISISNTDGIVAVVTEENTENEISTFALSGTSIVIDAILDEHYKDSSLKYNGVEIELGTVKTIDTNTNIIVASCSPKSYTLNFNMMGKGEQEPSQLVVYKTCAEKPSEQYYGGFIIDSWYKEDTLVNKWTFNTDVVLGDMTLYAKWIPYSKPTYITVNVPEVSPVPEFADKYITVSYSQQASEAVTVDWGDGSPKEYSSRIDIITLPHRYEKAGTYIIEISGKANKYTLGNNFNVQIVNPAVYITDVDFAWDIASVQSYALKGSSLTKTCITPFMTSVALGLFRECHNITEIIIPDNIQSIEDQAFQVCDNAVGEIILPKKLTKIGNAAFDACSKITSVKFNDKYVGSINYGKYAFRSCSSLTSITFSPNMLYLPDSMFAECHSLESITIPEHIIQLGTSVFAFSSNLSKVVLKNSDLVIGELCFNYCPNLQTAGPIGGNYDIEYAWKTVIPDHAFQCGAGQSYISSITLANTITTIGKQAFENTNITTINLPNALTTIKARAFSACRSLVNIDIPFNVYSIEQRAFEYCTGLRWAKIRGTTNTPKIDTDTQAWFIDINVSTAQKPDFIAYINDSIYADSYTAYGASWDVYTVSGGVGYTFNFKKLSEF